MLGGGESLGCSRDHERVTNAFFVGINIYKLNGKAN